MEALYKIAPEDLLLMGIGAQWSLQGGALDSCVIKPGIAQRRMGSCRRSLPEKGLSKKQEAGQSKEKAQKLNWQGCSEQAGSLTV